MAPEQGMQLSQQSQTPQQPQKPQPRSDMPNPEVGGNRAPMNYGQRPGGDATFPQESIVQGQNSYGGVVRQALERSRSRR